MLCYNEDEDTWDMGILGISIIIINTLNHVLHSYVQCLIDMYIYDILCNNISMETALTLFISFYAQWKHSL